MQWNLNREIWSAQKMKNHINVLELVSIKVAIQTFSKTLKYKAIHLQVDNMVAITYLLKIGWGWGLGYPEFEISPTSKRNMGSFTPMLDQSYCRVPFQQTERDSRLIVKKQFGHPRNGS